MLHPSYGELIDKINQVNEENGDPKINSRYTLIMAISRRARDLVDGAPKMVEDKYHGRVLSISVAEADAGKMGVVIASPDEDENKDVPVDEMSDVDLSTPIADET